jgi:hypothetical protein
MAQVSNDIPSRPKAEDALRESNTKFRILTELTASAIFIIKGCD